MIALDPTQPKGIIWLASYPRSGNTWLRAFLYQFARVQRGLPNEDDAINHIERVSATEANLNLLYEKLLGKPLTAATPDETMTARARVHAAVAERATGPAFLKTHSLLGRLGRRQTINTDVSIGAVYLVRDPRDVAVSLADYRGKSIDETVALVNLRDAFMPSDGRSAGEPWGSWSQNVDSWVDGANDTLLAVRYEDLLAAPVDTFTRIIVHLRQKGTEDQIREAVRLSSFEALKAQEKKHGFQLAPANGAAFFATGKSGGWRDRLTAEQADAIVEAHGETMRKFSYLD